MENTKQHVALGAFTFQQEVLDQRIEHAKFLFLRSYAAVDRYSQPVPILMPKLQKLFAAGRVLSENHPTITTGGFTVFLLKENIQQLLEDVATETTAKYNDDLVVEKQKQQQILEEQLYQAQVDKETKKAADREAKLRADAAKEAQDFFANLGAK
ncbi:hypothetical protein [Pseudomonas sp. CCI1.1]|uniref:hypothetical protein n=1 Tax=Pseudomonas sp. CCI1.1 TaxID=3048613 RepID=UPI002AC9980E|nr:hypothetical protein [Pseudomonas sp. CCI1.1]MEB0191124.1 hypothetical protein [Pseudomonas sp. CCI1.1]WPX48435.1 hypothetical protein RHM69_29735 [Pseudomonas sp. CCI1.1]